MSDPNSDPSSPSGAERGDSPSGAERGDSPSGAERGDRPELDDAPPVLGSWRNVYAAVLGTLAVLVTVFWALTRAYG